MTKGYPGQLKRNKPDIRCEDCGMLLEYLDEEMNIVICPECLITYDLKIYRRIKK